MRSVSKSTWTISVPTTIQRGFAKPSRWEWTAFRRTTPTSFYGIYKTIQAIQNKRSNVELGSPPSQRACERFREGGRGVGQSWFAGGRAVVEPVCTFEFAGGCGFSVPLESPLEQPVSRALNRA